VGHAGRGRRRDHDGDPVARPPVSGSDGGEAQVTRRGEKPTTTRVSKHRSTLARGYAVRAFLLLPGAHAIGHAVVEVGRAHDGLYAPEPHSLSYLVAHPGEGEADTLAL